MPFANLHTHTYFSDGLKGLDDLAHQVLNHTDLKYFALTDHDSMSGIEPLFRVLNNLKSVENLSDRRFIPGIELSLLDEPSNLTVHVLGLFPYVNEENCKEELRRIDSVIGDFCRYRGENRAIKDLDARVERAYEMNLDGIAEQYDSPKIIIRTLRDKADEKNKARFKKNEKETDVIRHPIPITYQTLIDHWEEMFPTSTREKATLYILRPGQTKIERLAEIYTSEGMGASEAMQLAEKNQGALVSFKGPVLKEMGILEGLSLLRKARAVSILCHPAVDHSKVGYEAFDQQILNPLMENGLDGIEVFYPYDPSYRNEAIERYRSIAEKHNLLISGGTDYHGDGRVGMDDVKLDVEHALKIINYK